MLNPRWYEEAQKYVGLKEIVGSKHEPEIVNFFSLSGNSWVKDDETAWCGAFVAAMFNKTGYEHIRPPGEKANALRAREWLKVGSPVEVPSPGDIVVFWRNKKSGSEGHVGFYVGETATHIRVLGGNQSNSVSIAQYSKDNLLGYRRVSNSSERNTPPPRQPTEQSLPVQTKTSFIVKLLKWITGLFK